MSPEERATWKRQKAIEKEILEALETAYEISTSTMKNKMEELTGGFNLNLPGITDGQ